MSKRVRIIIIAAAAALLLLGAVLIFTLLPEKTKDNTSSTASGISSEEQKNEQGYIPVYAFENDNVRKVSVKNTTGEYIVKYVKSGEWCLDGFEKFGINSDAMNTFISQCAEFSSIKIIAQAPEDFAAYGLDNPSATVTIEYSTDEKLTILTGGAVASGGNYIYIKENDKVYIADSGWTTAFENKYSLLLDLNLTDAIETDEEGNEILPTVKKISYSGRGLKNPIVIEENPEYVAQNKVLENLSSGQTTAQTVNASEFIFTAPFDADVSNDKFSGKQYDYFGVVAEDVDVLSPTQSDLASRGLANPYVTVSVVTSDGSFDIKLGNSFEKDSNKFYYATATGKTPIYIVDAENFTFFEEDLINYMSELVVNVLIDDIKTVRIETGGKNYLFELSGTGDDLVIRWDGKKMSTAEFRDLYQLIMLAYCEESVEPGKYTGAPDLKVTYTYRKTDKIDTVEYVKAETRRYLIRHNGSDLATVRSKYVDTLIYGVTQFISGKDVPSDY